MKTFAFCIFLLSVTSIATGQTADFTYSTASGNLCSPVTVQFKETASGNPTGFFWQFGNGTASNQANPSVNYSTAGTFSVKLIAIYPGNVTVSATKSIVINSATPPTLVAGRSALCSPATVTFTGSGSGAVSNYAWDFGDGTFLNTTANSISHNYGSFGVDTVALTVTYSTGCLASNKTTVTIAPLKILGTASPKFGCVPQTTNFTANVNLPGGSSITNYSWNFGDGSPVVITPGNVVNHTFLNPGNYAPKVTVTTNDGCTGSFVYNGVGFGIPPTNQVAYASNPTFCASDTALFIGKASGANLYKWIFGDGNTGSTTDTIIQHKYSKLGPTTVIVESLNNYCYGSFGVININVIGVISSFNFLNNCSNKNAFSFINSSQGNLTSITWDFGDGTPVVHSLNATHTFPVSGNFVTTLTVTDSVTGCSDTYQQVIHTGQPDLINPDGTVCRHSTTTFSVINNPDTTANYYWHVAGQQPDTTKSPTLTIIADSLGNFANYVIIDHGPTYCPDTASLGHSFVIKGPDLSFTAPTSLCINNVYSVSNTSHPFLPADSIVSWSWDFGDQSNIENTFQPQPHTYANAGTYTVTLSAADRNGCLDTLTDTVAMHPLPFIFAVPRVDTLCAGSHDTLFALSGSSLQWSPAGSLSCATCDTVVTSAASNTTYHILATTQFGCTASDSISVKVYSPFSAVPSVSDYYICPGDTIRFHVDPPGKVILWSPATGLSAANRYDPVAQPLFSTTYTATLSDSVGCFSSTATFNMHVKTLPTVNAGPDQTVPYHSAFTINPAYSNDIASYLWTPGSQLSCTTCPDPNGIADSSQAYLITVASDSGCVATDTINIFVDCNEVNLLLPNAFTPNHDGLNDYFYPITRGVRSIIRFAIYNRFGVKVFEADDFAPNNKAFGWDGMVNGRNQQSDVYVYFMEAICDTGQRLYKKGTVTLLR